MTDASSNITSDDGGRRVDVIDAIHIYHVYFSAKQSERTALDEEVERLNRLLVEHYGQEEVAL